MHIYKFIIAIILLIVLKNSSCLAADTAFVERYEIIFDLEDQWQVFDEDYQAYVPYIKEAHGNPYALHFDLDLNNYKGYHLLIKSPQPVYLFIQAQLYKQLSADDRVILNIDSLRRVHDQPKLFFSLYNNNRHTVLPLASIIYNPEFFLSLETQPSLLTPLKLRTNSILADFLIVAAVLILALYAFLWNYHPKAFSTYYNLGSVFSFSSKEDTVLVSRPLSRLNILFMLNHSFLLSFLYILIQKSSGRLLVYDHLLQPINTFGELFLFFIILGIFICILLIVKYFFILFLGSLFNLSKIIHIHFYEYLLFSRIFYSVVVPVIFVIFITYPWIIPLAIEELILIIIIFNFTRVFIINFALNKLTSVKNLYLFSYLCATELIPLLIGIKVLVNN